MSFIDTLKRSLGYEDVEGSENESSFSFSEFIITLYCLACIFYIFSLYKLVEYRNLEFYPSFSAFTFPFVISAIATKSVIKLTQNALLMPVETMQTVIAIIAVFYVLSQYINFLKKE